MQNSRFNKTVDSTYNDITGDMPMCALRDHRAGRALEPAAGAASQLPTDAEHPLLSCRCIMLYWYVVSATAQLSYG